MGDELRARKSKKASHHTYFLILHENKQQQKKKREKRKFYEVRKALLNPTYSKSSRKLISPKKMTNSQILIS